jgi:hypothetical protein
MLQRCEEAFAILHSTSVTNADNERLRSVQMCDRIAATSEKLPACRGETKLKKSEDHIRYMRFDVLAARNIKVSFSGCYTA